MFDERQHRHRTWTDEQLVEAVRNSTSMLQVSHRLGLSNSAAHRTLPKHIKRLGLDTSGLIGRCASGNRTTVRFNKIPLEDLLKEGVETNSHRLKMKLVSAGFLKYECSGDGCGLSFWQGKKIALQLDHKNGNRNDNRLENLRLLCPNCHSQTDTYAGKNKKRKYYV